MISLFDLLFPTDQQKLLIRKTIITYFTLREINHFIQTTHLALNIINVISDDDDNDYKFFLNKLILTSSLCDHIQYNSSNERRHFSYDEYPPKRSLLDLMLPKLQSLEVKTYVVVKRSVLLKLVDAFEDERLLELSVSRMNTNACLVFAGLFIPRIGHGLRSLTLGGYGFTSAMPISDNQINQILSFIPSLEQLKLMKLNLLSSCSIKSISNSTKLKKLEIISCSNMRMDKNSVHQLKLLLDKLPLTYIDIRYSIECCNSILISLCDRAEVNSKSSSLTDDRENPISPFELDAFLSSRTIKNSPTNQLSVEVWENFQNVFNSAAILFVDFIRDETSSRSKNHAFLHNHNDETSYATYDIPLVLNKQTSFAVRQSMNSPSTKFKDVLNRKLSTTKSNYALDKMCMAFEHIGVDTHRKDTFIKLKTPTSSASSAKYTTMETDDMCFTLKNCYGK